MSQKTTIIHYINENFNKYPNKAAIIFNDKIYSYREVSKLTSNLCNSFLEMGVKQHTKILLILDNSIEFVITMLAASELGLIIIPINPTTPFDTIKKYIERVKPNFIIADDIIFKKYQQYLEIIINSMRWISVKSTIKNSKCFNDIFSQNNTNYLYGMKNINPDEPYILTMTSGSTGSPKPIVFSQTTKIKRAFLSAKEIYNLTEEDIIIAASPMYHSLAQRLVLLPLMLGGTSIILKKFMPKDWLGNVEKYKATFSIVVSSTLELLLIELEKSQYDIASLKNLVSSSALLKYDLKQRCIEKFNAQFHEMYGASEIGTATNLYPQDDKIKFNSVGRALPYVDIKIINDEGQELKSFEIGEIICKSETKFLYYYDNEEATNTSVRNDYFYTGDLGYLDDDGFLYYKGRKKDIIKVGGIIVYPKDIEDLVLSEQSVLECACIGIDDKYFGEVIMLVIVVRDFNTFSLNNIKKLCREQLSDFQQPMAYEILSELPKNNMGKIMKYKLKEKFVGYDATKILRKLLGMNDE